jgi:hypothetical protein
VRRRYGRLSAVVEVCVGAGLVSQALAPVACEQLTFMFGAQL